jgi:hypothetical protein
MVPALADRIRVSTQLCVGLSGHPHQLRSRPLPRLESIRKPATPSNTPFFFSTIQRKLESGASPTPDLSDGDHDLDRHGLPKRRPDHID